MKVPSIRWQPLILGLLIAGTLATLGWSAFTHFGAQDPFMPHAHCYLLKRDLILLHGISDFLIGTSYVAISATLTYLVLRARREIPFHWMMLAFATFIIACGATHFMEVWTLQAANPPYWLSGDVKLVTALASVATAFLLPPLIPSILRLLEEARLSGVRRLEVERANVELAAANEKITQLDQLKTTFFANVSHELRTPLTLIFGPVDRLLGGTALDDAERRELQTVRRNALLLHKHVNDLLDVSKLEAGKMAVRYAGVDLARMARLVGSFFSSSQTHGPEIAIEAPESLAIEADAEKIERVLLNLLSNAFKFSPDGGRVRMSVRTEGEAALIRVEDSGPGVPEHLRAKIFERFAQGDQPTARGGSGTGLGLSIVREFVELHGGSVAAEEAVGGGAAFVVRLPLRAPAGVPVSHGAAAPGGDAIYRRPERVRDVVAWSIVPVAAPTGGTVPSPAALAAEPLVLVVEDNAEMAAHIAQTLGGEYRVALAPNGRAALELAEAQMPDVIVTDLMMPEMTGDELLTQVRAHPRLRNVPVILLTARADDEMKLRLLANGAQDYLVKPFAAEELRVRVRNHVTTKQVRDALQGELASHELDLASLAREMTLRSRDLVRAKESAEAASRAKDHFLAVLSHELRTPLTPALTVATNLHEHPPQDPGELREALGVIRRNIELEAKLIDDLLDLTRIARGKLQLHFAPVDLHDLIRYTTEMIRSEHLKKTVRLEMKLDAAEHHSRGDAPRLQQVIWNLVGNAVKFTPAGGVVTIRTANRDGLLVVETSDTGIGISSEMLAKIFDPFEQGERAAAQQHGGLGLGLAVAKGLIEAHGGTIVASSGGHSAGATFTVELPVSAPPAEPASERAPAPGALAAELARPMRVLLVEDHEDTRQALERLLRRWGYEVESACCVKEGLEKGRAGNFDLLLSDLGLPDGTGSELMSALRAERGLPGIAMSGFGMEEDLRRSAEAGFHEHLTKPVAPTRLREAMERALRVP